MSNDGRTNGASALRQHWPILVVVLLGAIAWADLRGEVRELREGMSSGEDASPAPAPPGPVVGEQPPQQPVAPRPPDPWRCQGTIGEEQLRGVIGQHGRAVFDCYEQRRAADPNVRGTLNVELRVDQAGRAADVRFGGRLAEDATLGGCVRNATSTWQFPQPSGGSCAVVSMPFAFGAPTPSNAAAE